MITHSNKILLLISIAVATLLSSCTRFDDDNIEISSQSEVMVTFSSPFLSNITTKSSTDPDQPTIEGVTVVVFADDTADSDVAQQVCYISISAFDTSVATDLVESDEESLVIAFINMDLTSSIYQGVTTYSQVKATILNSSDLELYDSEGMVSSNVPMVATIESTTINRHSLLSFTAELLTAMVKVNAEDVESNYELISASLYDGYTQANILSSDSSALSADRTRETTIDREESTLGEDNIISPLHLFPTLDSDDKTDIIIRGSYTDSNGNVSWGYHKLRIVYDNNGDQYSINRGDRYTINITSVDSPGYINLDDAIEGVPSNDIEYSIIIYTDDYSGYSNGYIFDNIKYTLADNNSYALGVSTDEYIIHGNSPKALRDPYDSDVQLNYGDNTLSIRLIGAIAVDDDLNDVSSPSYIYVESADPSRLLIYESYELSYNNNSAQQILSVTKSTSSSLTSSISKNSLSSELVLYPSSESTIRDTDFATTMSLDSSIATFSSNESSSLAITEKLLNSSNEIDASISLYLLDAFESGDSVDLVVRYGTIRKNITIKLEDILGFYLEETDEMIESYNNAYEPLANIDITRYWNNSLSSANSLIQSVETISTSAMVVMATDEYYTYDPTLRDTPGLNHVALNLFDESTNKLVSVSLYNDGLDYDTETYESEYSDNNSIASYSSICNYYKVQSKDDLINMRDWYNCYTYTGNIASEMMSLNSSTASSATSTTPALFSSGATTSSINTASTSSSLDTYIYSTNIYFNLTTDIDLENKEWIPIGNSLLSHTLSDGSSLNRTSEFSGCFNGNGHTISGLKITSSETSYDFELDGTTPTQSITTPALFGMVKGAYILDLNVEGTISALNSAEYTAGVVAYSPNDLALSNVHFSGSIVSESNIIGGLIGSITSSSYISIKECSNSASITANYSQGVAGGIIGAINLPFNINSECENYIYHSYNSGDIRGDNINYIGGIIGYLYATNDDLYFPARYIYNTGDITGGEYLGGLIGHSSNAFLKLNDTYNNGAVTGSSKSTIAGGLVGYLYTTSGNYTYDDESFSVSYNSGVVSGATTIGGIIGKSILPDSHYDGDTTFSLSETTYSDESSVDNGSLTYTKGTVSNTATTLAEMQSSDFTDWLNYSSTNRSSDLTNYYNWHQESDNSLPSFTTDPVIDDYGYSIIEVTTEEEFYVAAAQPFTLVRVMNDIDIYQDLDLDALGLDGYILAANIDGNGYTLTLKDCSGGVFSVNDSFNDHIDNPNIISSTVENMSIASTTKSSSITGLSQAKSYSQTITDLTVAGTILTTTTTEYSETDISGIISTDYISWCGGFVNIISNARVDFINCTNKANITPGSTTDCIFAAGGFVGHATHGTLYFNNCINEGDIYSNMLAGGLLGGDYITTGLDLYINNCENRGDIYAETNQALLDTSLTLQYGDTATDQLTIDLGYYPILAVGGLVGKIGECSIMETRYLSTCVMSSNIAEMNAPWGSYMTILNSKNSGKVSASAPESLTYIDEYGYDLFSIAGIVGSYTGADSPYYYTDNYYDTSTMSTLPSYAYTLYNCSNSGEISQESSVAQFSSRCHTAGIIDQLEVYDYLNYYNDSDYTIDLEDGYTSIYNCSNSAPLTSSDGSGAGVVIYNKNSTYNCTNSGDIIGGAAAGVCQFTTGSIYYCENSGDIEVSYYAGGIVMDISGDYSTGDVPIIKGCNNSGNITLRQDNSITDPLFFVGGIAGVTSGTIIRESNNWGNITNQTGYGFIGGILGCMTEQSYIYENFCARDNILINCYNGGDIISYSDTTGGIVGQFFEQSSDYQEADTTLDLSTNDQYINQIRSAVNCYNTGSITGTYAGGLAGEAKHISFTNCYTTASNVVVTEGYPENFTRCYYVGSESSCGTAITQNYLSNVRFWMLMDEGTDSYNTSVSDSRYPLLYANYWKYNESSYPTIKDMSYGE